MMLLRDPPSWNHSASQPATPADSARKAAALAIKDPKFGDAVNITFAPVLGARIGDTAQDILDHNKDFAQQSYVRQLFEQHDNTGAGLADLKKTSNRQLSGQTASIDGLRSDIRKTLATFHASDRAAAASEIAQQAQVARNMAEQQLQLSALRSGIYILGHLLGDTNASKGFVGAASAIIDVHLALRAYEKNLSLVNGTNFASTASAAVLTGNLLSIGLQLAATFGETGPTSDQVIMGQLRQLSQQLVDFQKETRDRFNQVDSELNTIFTKVQEGFRDIALSVALSYDSVRQAQESIGYVVSRLDQVENRLASFMKLIVTQQYNQQMTRCLARVARYGQAAALNSGQFADCTAAIAQFSHEASDPANAGNWNAGTSFEILDRQLADEDWSASVNTIRELASDLSPYASDTTRLANPMMWASATSSYVQLALENPSLFKSAPSVQLDDLTKEGLDIDRELATVMVSQNPEKFLNLCDKLLEQYVTAMWDVSAEAKKLEINEMVNTRLNVYQYGFRTLLTSPTFQSDRNIGPLSDKSFAQPAERAEMIGRPGVFYDQSYNAADLTVNYAGWPSIPAQNASRIWGGLDGQVWQREYFGGEKLSAEYEFRWKNLQWEQFSYGPERIWAMPSLVIHIFSLGADGVKRQVTQGTVIENVPTLVESKPPGVLPFNQFKYISGTEFEPDGLQEDTNRSYSPGRGLGLLSASLDAGRARVRSARNAVGRFFDGGSALEGRGLA